jgi:hypothetical protein
VPPAGFTAATLPKSKNTPNSIDDLFSGSLSGKQVWLLRAPAGTDVSTVLAAAKQSTSLSKIRRGESILVAPAGDDGVQKMRLLRGAAGESGGWAVLVPRPEGYVPIKAKVSKVWDLQSALPDLSPAKMANGNEKALAGGKTKHVQPKGLRMRYKPMGFGEGDPGALGELEEGEAEPEPPQKELRLDKTPAAEHTKQSKKRKPEEDSTPHTSKKAKKSKDDQTVKSDNQTPKSSDTREKDEKKLEEKKSRHHSSKEKHHRESKSSKDKHHSDREKSKDKHRSDRDSKHESRDKEHKSSKDESRERHKSSKDRHHDRDKSKDRHRDKSSKGSNGDKKERSKHKNHDGKKIAS